MTNIIIPVGLKVDSIHPVDTAAEKKMLNIKMVLCMTILEQ